MITGLAGVRVQDGNVSFRPIIPDDWEYFSLDNLYIRGSRYRIVYDKTGKKYGHTGWKFYKNNICEK